MDKKGGIKCNQRIVNNLNLHNIWRIQNPGVQSFTWSQKSPFVYSRFYYWLTSVHLFDHINNVNICPAITTDHATVVTEFNMIEQQLKGAGFWKVNVSLLMNDDYVIKMTLEWIKSKIREFSVDFSKKVASKKTNRTKQKTERKRKKNLTYSRIMVLSLKVVHELNPPNDTFYDLEKFKSEVELLEERKTQGIIVRTRAKWYEQGEKSNKYFLSLEKRNHIRKHVRKLNL